MANVSETGPRAFEVQVVTAAAVWPVPEVMASAPEAPTPEQNPEPLVFLSDTASEPQDETQAGTRGIALRRLAAGGALAGFVVLGGAATAQASEIAPATTTVEAQGQSSESSTPIWIVGGSLAVTTLGMIASNWVSSTNIRKSSHEKQADRFAATIKEIEGDSTGQAQVMQLHALTPYTQSKEFAPLVARTSVAYLRARRGQIDELRAQHREETEEFEAGVRNTRNAAREALNILLTALPLAREQLPGQSRIKSLLTKKSPLEDLAELTDAFTEDKSRVDARAINLDYMRDIKSADFHDTDLTGAGLQGNQLSNVVFRNARLSEAQLEGSTLFKCDLREADFRAAYLFCATIEKCVVDKNTKFGNLPDNHPDARFGSLDPEDPEKHRGNPEVILKDLISKKLSKEEIIKLVHDWQRDGLVLCEGSNPEYFLTPELSADQTVQ